MLMGTHQKLNSVKSFTVYVHDTYLEHVYIFKYLRVILDPCLSWNELMGNKISSRLRMLQKVHNAIPREACVTLFNAVVLPLFGCCCMWAACGQGNKNYLDSLLKWAASIIEGHKVSSAEIHQMLKCPSQMLASF